MAFFTFNDYPSERQLLWPGQSLIRRPGNSLLTSVFNDGFRELQRLERELGHLQNKDEADVFTFECNVAGYHPDELNVDIEGKELVIKGEHKQSGEGQSIHRTFVRRLTVPDDVLKDSIVCNIDEKGRLNVKGQRKEAIESKKQNIPIGFKKSTEASVVENNDNKDK